MTRAPIGTLAWLLLFAIACGVESSEEAPASAAPDGGVVGSPGEGGAAGGDAAAGPSDAGTPADAAYVPPDLGPMPAWRQGIAKWQWKEIPATSMTSVKVADPFSGAMVAPSQRIDAWNGLAANRDTNRIYLAGAGGHADWAGNEAYEIDLHQDQPAWKLLRGSTMAPDVLASSAGSYHHYYADGRPSSTHLYFALQFVRSRGRVFKMCAGSLWGTGNEANNKVDAFDLAKNDWDPAGTFAETPGGSYPSPTADGEVIARPFAQHPDTEDIYSFFTGAFRKWSAASATWSKLAAKPSYANNDIVRESASAVDPKRNKVLFATNRYRVQEREGLVYDITSDTLAEVTYTGSAAATAVDTSQALVFVPSEDAYVLKSKTGGVVVRIDPTSFAAEPVATTGPVPPDPAHGIYTRWLYLPLLKGIAYVPTGSSNVWFLPTE